MAGLIVMTSHFGVFALAFVFLIAFIAAIVGLIRPFKFLPQLKRWHYASLAALFFVLTGLTAPEPEKQVATAIPKAQPVAKPVPTKQAEPKPAPVSTAIADAEKTYPAIALPKGAPPAPVTGFCRDEMCEVTKVQFVNNDWPKAWAGDYQGQRNAAFCRATGCRGAVQIDHAEACAWRAVILARHPRESGDMDTASLKTDCAQLDAAATALAQLKAQDMERSIK